MKSLHFISRQLDGQFASHAATPPPTPTRDAMNELLRDDATRPLRTKSYARIAPRRSLDPRGHPIHAHDRTTPWGLPPQQQFQKRSYSSPALWSFRKTSSPTPSLTSSPQPASPNGPPPSYFPQIEEPCPISEHIDHAHVPLRILRIVWKAIYSVWLILSGWLLIRRPAQRGKGREKRGGDQNEESIEEIEESEDDVLVTRAPKRSYSPPPDTDVRYGDAAASFSFPTASSSERATPAPLLDAEEPVLQKRKGTPKIDLTPPTPKVNQAMFATGISMTTAMIETMTITDPSEPSPPFSSSTGPPPQLLPNPIGSCLLTGAAVPVAITPVSTPPPKKTPGLHLQKTLVLDLDETLIHSTSRPMHAHTGGGNLFNIPGLGFIFGNKRGAKASGHMVEVVLGGRSTLYHVYKRPFVDYFLRKVSTWYTLVVFTASVQEYADPVIDWLDGGHGILGRRFFRESCTQLANGSYTKDLSLVESDLARICLIDNSPISYSVNPANGIPIEGWISDPSDEALLHLLPVLDSLRFASDVRRILGLRIF